MSFDLFDLKTRQLEEAVDESKRTLEEVNVCGDLEDLIKAAQAVEDAEINLSRHLLTDRQEDRIEPLF